MGPTATTSVVHWNDRPTEGWVYIGRPSPWGNPYRATRGISRERAIELFRGWFLSRVANDRRFRVATERTLAGRVLVCHCKPLACHGDVIAEYLNRVA